MKFIGTIKLKVCSTVCFSYIPRKISYINLIQTEVNLKFGLYLIRGK